ncbi:MAG: nitroreductase family deazaflavin-dependent oxidoreductase [Rubrobacteraceae bacterium]
MATNTGKTSRGRAYPPMADKMFRLVSAAHTFVYRTTRGRVAGRMQGSPVLLLATRGRKTGKERTVPLLYLPDGPNMVIVASKGGAAKHPAWWLNLRANPEAEAQVGGRRLRVVAEETGGQDRRRLWAKLVAMYPGYADYQRRTEREIPVVRLRPAERDGGR